MGDGVIGWQEIDAWCNRTGIELDAWESRTIRRLSRAFVSQRYAAEKPGCPAPYNGNRAHVTGQRDAIAQQVKSVFAGLITKR